MRTKDLMTRATGKNTYERLEDKIETAFEKEYWLEKKEKLDKTIKDNETIEVAE